MKSKTKIGTLAKRLARLGASVNECNLIGAGATPQQAADYMRWLTSRRGHHRPILAMMQRKAGWLPKSQRVRA